MIKLIVFDLDGTLINAYPAVEESVNYVLQYFDMPKQEKDAIQRAVGWGPKKLLEKFLSLKQIEEALKLYYQHHAGSLLRGSSLLPGAMDLLTKLKRRGHKLAVASNRPKDFSLIVTRHLEIEPLFDRILCGDEMSRPKPYPDILFQLMEEFNCLDDDILYVGDMVVDIETGVAAGVKTVAVTTGSSSLEEIQKAGPWRIISRVDGVLGLISS